MRAAAVTKSAQQGAQTQLFLSASDHISAPDSGRYFDNMAVADVSAEAADSEKARKLWQVSEELTGLQFSV